MWNHGLDEFGMPRLGSSRSTPRRLKLLFRRAFAWAKGFQQDFMTGSQFVCEALPCGSLMIFVSEEETEEQVASVLEEQVWCHLAS